MRCPYLNTSGNREGHRIIAPTGLGVAHVELADWPIWALVIANFRHQEDVGLGDTIAHLIGDERSKRFQEWFKRKVGRSCGCTERRKWLNQRYPYSLFDLTK